MYQIYCIAYKISDEIKAQKESQKPFWWDHVHPDVREQTLTQIEQELTQNGAVSPQILAEMTKNEKFLVVSNGAYSVEHSSAEELTKELEMLKGEVERSKTEFLNRSSDVTSGLASSANSSMLMHEDNFEPIAFGKKPMAIPSDRDNLSAVKSNMGNMDNMDMPMFEDSSKSGSMKGEMTSPFSGAVKDVGEIEKSTPGMPTNRAEIRRYAQSIVSSAVKDINKRADEIPDDVAGLKEKELLSAVIEELKDIESRQPK